MRELQNFVNLVPVIAKADSLTLAEREAFKLRVRVCFMVRLQLTWLSPK
jgi:septin family protein